ncbi:hypothetical protein [Streptomyces griseofuscus]|uniref:hypothetical protein n=1 Tax=Streptomyces griseofuscus TaxID=146922 RepID=UPI000F646D02|nr:hypothetical protein [Streptomyces griseofuscus]
MALYVSQVSLREAVNRLRESSMPAALGDYLIFKRALEIRKVQAREAGALAPSTVITGTKSPHFVQAIEELTGCAADSASIAKSENPYFNPFGAARETTSGYRTHKFPSNGPSDTVGRWQSRTGTPLRLVPDSKPKEYRFEEQTEDQLRSFFASKNSGQPPSILDTAIWWFRFTDLEQRFQHEPSENELIAATVTDLGLTGVEISALFSLPDLSLTSRDSYSDEVSP